MTAARNDNPTRKEVPIHYKDYTVNRLVNLRFLEETRPLLLITEDYSRCYWNE